MRLICLILAISGIVLTTSGCGGTGDQVSQMETTTSGTIYLSVDESFKPVIDSEVQVFESLHPEAHIIVHYKPEADCLKDLENDSIRMVIVTRGLTEEERAGLEKNLKFSPRYIPCTQLPRFSPSEENLTPAGHFYHLPNSLPTTRSRRC